MAIWYLKFAILNSSIKETLIYSLYIFTKESHQSTYAQN